VATPFDPSLLQHTSRRIEGRATESEIYEYASVIGKFTYSACVARPDIAFATSTWARFMSNPTDTQQKGLKRLPRICETPKKSYQISESERTPTRFAQQPGAICGRRRKLRVRSRRAKVSHRLRDFHGRRSGDLTITSSNYYYESFRGCRVCSGT
jgi:hypothetical protein